MDPGMMMCERGSRPRRSGASRISSWSIALLAVAVVLSLSGRTHATDLLALHMMVLGETVPPFDLPPVESGEPGLSDSDLSGNVSLVNVWASWCPPCREEHPVLMDLAQRDLVPLYGINYKDGSEGALWWLRSYGNPYVRNGFDPDGRVTAELGLFGLPQTFVIDAAGRIAYVHKGALTEEDVGRIIVPLVERLSAPRRSQATDIEP